MCILEDSTPLAITLLDFRACAAPSRKLIIELDGGGHLEQEEYDHERTVFLQSKGYTVLRFWNNDVMKDIDGVIHVILETLDTDQGAI